MKKVKVLYFVDRMLRGGIQSLVIDWVSRFDKEKIQVDFLLLDDGNKYELEDTLKELGCNVFKLDGIWINTPFDYIKYHKKANDFFKEHNDYNVVHLHSSSKNYPILKYAKKYNIPKRIVHSHNVDFQTTSKIKKIVGNVFKIPLKKYSTDFFACSVMAGEWLFGKRITQSNKFKVIHNAVDYEKFKFCDKSRRKIRREFNINDNTIVYGNIGRLSNQKNHKFLIDIFFEIKKLNHNVKLFLVGTGELENEIKNKVKRLDLSKDVIFAGFRNDVNEVIQAMDVFLMPSLHEGLPVVGIEAQASGLPCFMSKKVITPEVKIANNVQFISLEKTPREWANIIEKASLKRNNNLNFFKNEKYLIEDIIEELSTFYLEKRDNNEI